MDDRSSMRDTGAANLRFARALVGELHASGVVAAVICPGSRSTPLALALAELESLPHTVHIDERSAAFYALGFAKASGRPVVLLCTSGTAAANFLPAVAEAHHARVPLVVLTADRPPELRAWGAAQTMEQRGLYAGFTRWSEEAPCPDERDADAARHGYAVALARRAVCAALGMSPGPAPGPVHLNLPFREPLVPAAIDAPALRERADAAPFLQHLAWAPQSSPEPGSELRSATRGVLLFGPDSCDGSESGDAALKDAVHALAQSLGWPLLADPASGLRAGAAADSALITGADLLLREPSVAASLQPELIVRFGAPPTSAAINAWLARHAATPLWLVDPASGFRDPQHRATRLWPCSSLQFCELARASAAASSAPNGAPPGWLARWREMDRGARAAVASALAAQPEAAAAFLIPQIARTLWAEMPEDATLYIANSMAIREIDAFAGPRAARLRTLANRGVNGIDGQVSAALGAAAATGRPTVLWCGDLAFLHDVAGLVAGHRLRADLTIVVGNDDGGGIFEYLPVARAVARERFEEIFAVPHGMDLCAVARGFGWDAVRVNSAAAFSQTLARSLAGGRHVIEVPVERSANTRLHAVLNDAVRAALRRESPA